MRLLLQVTADGHILGSSPDAPGWHLSAAGPEALWAQLRAALTIANRRTVYLTAKGEQAEECGECGTTLVLDVFTPSPVLRITRTEDGREVTCVDCFDKFIAKRRGRLPIRCPECLGLRRRSSTEGTPAS